MKYIHSLLLLILFISFLPVLAAGKEKDRLSVMDVQDDDKVFNEKSRAKITDYVFSKFEATKKYYMIQKSVRDQALAVAIEETIEGSRKECVDDKCQLSMAAQLQANYLINVKIRKLYQSTCHISISMVEVQKNASDYNWEEKFNCTEKGLYEIIDSFYFGNSDNESAAFQTGKIGKLEDDWTPEMAGKGEVGLIYFESYPEGANIYFDRELLGRTPKFKSRSLATGRHQIKVEKEGYYTEVIMKDLKKGEKVSVTLFPGIRITSNPEGAVVRLNGKLLCDSTPCQKVIEEGKYELTFEKEMYQTKKQPFSIKKGTDVSVNLDPNFGWLEVKSKYGGIEVALDENLIGKTPIAKLQTSIGPHTIGAKHECYNIVGENIEIKRGETKTVEIDARPKMAAIDVSAKDSDGNDVEAELFIDGMKIGTTPFNNKILMCSQELQLIYDGITKKRGLFLKEKDEKKIEEVFEKRQEQVYSNSYNNGSYMDNYKKSYTETSFEKDNESKFKYSVEDEIVYDSGTGLMWQQTSAYTIMNQNDAINYCKYLDFGGYDDWTLPSISELKTLIAGCQSGTEACEVNDKCYDKNCWSENCKCQNEQGYGENGYYWEEGVWLGGGRWFWSSTSGGFYNKAWYVSFYNGNVGTDNTNLLGSVRCVRKQVGTGKDNSISSKQEQTKRTRSYRAWPGYEVKDVDFFLQFLTPGIGFSMANQYLFGGVAQFYIGMKIGPFAGTVEADVYFPSGFYTAGSKFRVYPWETPKDNYGYFISAGAGYSPEGVMILFDTGFQVTRLFAFSFFSSVSPQTGMVLWGLKAEINLFWFMLTDRNPSAKKPATTFKKTSSNSVRY